MKKKFRKKNNKKIFKNFDKRQMTSSDVIWRHLTSSDVSWRVRWRHMTSDDVRWRHMTSLRQPECFRCKFVLNKKNFSIIFPLISDPGTIEPLGKKVTLWLLKIFFTRFLKILFLSWSKKSWSKIILKF